MIAESDIFTEVQGADMTRKDYSLLAEVLRTHRRSVYQSAENLIQCSVLEQNLGARLLQDNPRFDVRNFLAVVRGEKDYTAKRQRVEKV